MSLAYFPLYADDFEADTAHLTLAEDGAYNRLLRLCWRTPGCSIPADRDWIYRRMRAHTDDDKAVVDIVLDEFFTTERGRSSNARLTKEYHAANEAHEKRKNAGSKGGASKALKTNNSRSSNAKAMLKQCSSNQNQNHSLKREAKASPKKATRLPVAWTLPKDWAEWAVSQGWPEPVVRSEAEKFRDYWIGKSGANATKLDWLATWRNWMRNSKSPKIINGGGYEPSKQSQRLDAFIAGARGTS